MASFRVLQPLARQAPRMISRSTSIASRRFLNTDTAPILTTARANVIGARAQGHIEGDALFIDLGMPKSLGGDGTKTNPEELFAAGYGACFQSAMNIAAGQVDVKLPKQKEDSIIETAVHLVGDMKAVDLGIRVDMKIKVKGVTQEELEKVVERTKELCPYSRAVKGNVTTTIVCEAS